MERVAGIEPAHVWVEARCLSAWRHPLKQGQSCTVPSQASGKPGLYRKRYAGEPPCSTPVLPVHDSCIKILARLLADVRRRRSGFIGVHLTPRRDNLPNLCFQRHSASVVRESTTFWDEPIVTPKLVDMEGIEPPTSACKADVIPLNYTPTWSPRRDSNSRPAVYKTAALTN